uniref:Spaetzle domain-containing protein n=1 Tax=Wuchereria bancrofti TaxID=6293 RepID=A0AAF5PJ75_WUCBA
MQSDHGRGEGMLVWSNHRAMDKWKCRAISGVVLLTPKETTLLSIFPTSTAFRICFITMLLSTTVHSVMLTTDQHQQDEVAVAACTQTDLSSASESELLSCRRHYRSLLQKVNGELTRVSRQKRYSPVSASLPNRESTFFLDHLKAIRLSREEELNRTLSEANDEILQKRRRPFVPRRNSTAEECRQLSQQELVNELKQKGTYNPDLMAWDASGIIRFLDRSIGDQYERQSKTRLSVEETMERNVEALERILSELNIECDVRSPSVISRLQNLTSTESRRTVISPSIRMMDSELERNKRGTTESVIDSLITSGAVDAHTKGDLIMRKRQKLIDVHVIPFGCDKRGGEEDGYLRLCGACQAIRRLPDTFFPPFINEVMCDDDKACLYFYDFPHGKCTQKHMNFVVLKNVGTDDCQIWQKFNLNVRVSCECFVDEMSFFAKYV